MLRFKLNHVNKKTATGGSSLYLNSYSICIIVMIALSWLYNCHNISIKSTPPHQKTDIYANAQKYV